MSWTSVYRWALRLLPASLRHKHGQAMEDLFAREIGRARTRGRLQGVLAGAAGMWDVIRRGVYERLRPDLDVAHDRGDARSPEWWSGATHDSKLAHAHSAYPRAPRPASRQLLRRHAISFATAFVALTVLLLASFAKRQLPALSTRGGPDGAILEALLLAVPFIAALTIPMAVFVSVLREFTRLGADGTLAAARREPRGIRRLVAPVLVAAAGVAALAFLVTAEIVPRANARLLTVLEQRATAPTDRTMTIGELRKAAERVPSEAEPLALAREARYEVEIQKKLALPAACLILALAAIAIAFSVPRGGMALVIVASVAVFGAYYAMMVTGETLANQLVISPFVGMWAANALLLAAVLLANARRRSLLG